MMVRRLLLVLAFYGAMAPSFCLAGDEFSKYNPDIMKYEFARSYITALGYMKDIHDRWAKNTPKEHSTPQKLKMIQVTINDLAWDNSDLFIIKNYMRKYLVSPNMLMRKVADMMVVATARDILINHEEKALWQKWYDLNAAGQATSPKEKEFLKSQYLLELQRKEANKDMIKASIMMTRVLMSEKNKNGKGHLLAITAQQRQKLLDKLDSFGSDTLHWGLDSGQNTEEGSVAVIREVLEDSLCTTIDEK